MIPNQDQRTLSMRPIWPGNGSEELGDAPPFHLIGPPLRDDVAHIDVAGVLGITPSPDAERAFVPAVVQPNASDRHWRVLQYAPPRTTAIVFSDWGYPHNPDVMIFDTQAQVGSSNRFGIMYPVAGERLRACLEFKRPPLAERRFDVGFVGWSGAGWKDQFMAESARELLDLRYRTCHDLARSGLRVDVEMYDVWGGRRAFKPWLDRTREWKIAFCPPGIGPNSWRLSELMLSGVAVVTTRDVTRVGFAERLRHGVNCISTDADNNVAQAVKPWLDDLAALARLAREGREFARRNAAWPGWCDSIRRRLS